MPVWAGAYSGTRGLSLCLVFYGIRAEVDFLKAFKITLCVSAVLFFLSFVYFIGSFYWDTSHRIDHYIFGSLPRLVYIANVDTELDFLGATIIAMSRGGYQVDEFPIEPWLVVDHNIDFTTPGVYKVRMSLDFHGRFNVIFWVQVIDEELFNQLSARAP